MGHRYETISILCTLFILTARVCLAQAPVGTIAGVVRDSSGAVISGTQVQAVSRATGQARTTVTSAEGDYSFPELLAGEYEVSAEALGFQRIVRAAMVEAGSATTTDFALRVGEVSRRDAELDRPY